MSNMFGSKKEKKKETRNHKQRSGTTHALKAVLPLLHEHQYDVPSDASGKTSIPL